MSVGASRSCNKWHQLTTTWPIAMDAIKAITYCSGCNQRHHCEAPKRSWDEPLNRDKEGRGDQPQSHKAALPANATRALWKHCEYHNDTHLATTIIVTGASIAMTQAWQMQEGDTQCGKPQADWANSCPRSPATNVGSTIKHTKKTSQAKQKKTKPSWHKRHASRVTIARQASNQVAWQSQWHRP